MIWAQAMKKVALEPTSVTNGATVTLLIDRLGYDYATIDVQLGRAGATNTQPSTLKLQEADVTNASSFADITSPVTFAGTTLAAAAGLTNAVQVSTADVDLKPRKRYLQLVITPTSTNAQIIAAIANLSRAEKMPATAADKNVAVNVIG